MIGRAPGASQLVFLTPSGSSWEKNRRNALRALERLLSRAGIPKKDETGRQVDIHALRHTAASRLARSGASLVVTQKILGHSTPRLTSQVYTHLEADDLRAAVEALPDGIDGAKLPLPRGPLREDRRNHPSRGQEVARTTRLELATPGVTGRYSNQLSYVPAVGRGSIASRLPRSIAARETRGSASPRTR